MNRTAVLATTLLFSACGHDQSAHEHPQEPEKAAEPAAARPVSHTEPSAPAGPDGGSPTPPEEPPPAEPPGEHAHGSPHGGSVVTVGRYHYELVVRDRTFVVYLLDSRLNTLPVASVRGEIVVAHGRERYTLPLSPAGDHLEATGEHAESGDFVALVKLELEGRTQTGRISHHPPGHHP